MDAPENVCGLPVRDENFVGRTGDVERAWRRLETDHAVLAAPRRVGKTSLMYALEAGAPRRAGWLGAVYFSAEDTEDEQHFVAELYARIAKAPGCEEVRRRVKPGLWSKLSDRVSKVSVGALTLELRQRPATSWVQLATDLEDAVFALPPGRKLLLLVDELPVFLLKLRARDPARARAFLEWFRSFRQGRPERSHDLRWLLAGSIGLSPLAAREGWSKLINDLQPLGLGAHEPDEARTLLRGLSTRYRLGLTDPEEERILVRIGWPIPYFLQLLVGALREGRGGDARVDDAFAALLAPEMRKNFAPWWERLSEELGATDAEAARRVLGLCAADPAGARPDTLAGALGGEDPEARRRWLTDILEHDGYLVSVDGRWRFRSPLLREVWLDREAR